MTTPKLGIPELATSQANKEETVNEQVRKLEGFASYACIEDRDLPTPPGSPVDGAMYLVAASPTGAWVGHAGDIALRMNTGWEFHEVFEGLAIWVKDENQFLVHNGTAFAEPWDVDIGAALTALELDDISDVNTGAPADGEVLTWDDGAGEWVAAPAPGSGGGSGGTVPNGGSPGQSLVKLSGVDQDADWRGAGELHFDPPTTTTHATERKTAASFTASASNVTGHGLLLSLNPTGAGDKVIARLKAAPTAPFQIDIRFRHTPANATGSVGIMLYNSTNGRNLQLLQLTNGQYFSQSWSALETFNATITTGSTGMATDLHGWLRVTVDGSGNVAFFYSSDGAFYKAIGTTTLATYLTATGGSLDEVGVFARANGSGLTSGASFHYYRES